jgi:hypothetical protein
LRYRRLSRWSVRWGDVHLLAEDGGCGEERKEKIGFHLQGFLELGIKGD